MKFKWVARLLALAVPFSSLPVLQAQETAVRNLEYEMNKSAGAALPVSDLPAHIHAPAGELTLYADYAGVSAVGTPLYLINRTDAQITLPAQDGDLYAKLETTGRDHLWVRAQTHVNSFCGNSYFFRSLAPGQYFSFIGYQPVRGEKRKIRYTIYGSTLLSSNAGEGLIDWSDYDQAREDTFSLRGIPWEISRRLDPDPTSNPQSRESIQSQVAALRLLQSYGEVPRLRRGAEVLRETIARKSQKSAEDKKALAALDELSKGEWPLEPSRERLFQRCVQALTKTPSKLPYGSPEKEPALVWATLTDLALSSFQKDGLPTPSTGLRNPASWRPLMQHLLHAPNASQGPSNFPPARFFAVPELIDEGLPNEFFERHLNSSREITEACASVLARRGAKSRLVELAWSLPPTVQADIFGALTSLPGESEAVTSPRVPSSPAEEAFWRYCLEQQTVEAIGKLCQGAGLEFRGIEKMVRETVCEYLRQVANIDRQTPLAHEEVGLQMKLNVVQALGKVADSGDQELLSQLLTHKGYTKSTLYLGNSPDVFESRRYLIREAAKQALQSLGQTVSTEVVTEERILLKQKER